MRTDFGLNRTDTRCENCKTRPAYLFEHQLPGRTHYLCNYCTRLWNNKISTVLYDFDTMKASGQLYKELDSDVPKPV